MLRCLITTDEVYKLARTMSIHIDTEKIEAYIRESENIDLKSALGDALFLDVKEHPENYSELLNGSSYTIECGGKRSFVGLKTTLAYYTYARIVKNVSKYSTKVYLYLNIENLLCPIFYLILRLVLDKTTDDKILIPKFTAFYLTPI